MGYSPFGIEKEDTVGVLSKTYSTLRQLTPLILEHQVTGTIGAASLTKANATRDLKLGNYDIRIVLRQNSWGVTEAPERGYGLIISLGPDEYLAAGNDIDITFKPSGTDSIAGLLSVEEGSFVDTKWVPGRRMNGDEVQLRYDLSTAATEKESGAGLKFPSNQFSIQKVKLYKYK